MTKNKKIQSKTSSKKTCFTLVLRCQYCNLNFWLCVFPLRDQTTQMSISSAQKSGSTEKLKKKQLWHREFCCFHLIHKQEIYYSKFMLMYVWLKSYCKWEENVKAVTRLGPDIPSIHRNILGPCIQRLDFRYLTSRHPMKKRPTDLLTKSINTNNYVVSWVHNNNPNLRGRCQNSVMQFIRTLKIGEVVQQ